MKPVFIYQITCATEGKVYVGATVSLKSRWKSHRVALRAGTHHSRRLQNAWDQYGESDFSISILCECVNSNRRSEEQVWIDTCKAADDRFGYNVCKLAGRYVSESRGFRHKPSTIALLREKSIGRRVSDDAKKLISKAGAGRRWSAEQRVKVAALVRSPATEAKKLAISKGRGGRPFIVTTPDGTALSFDTLRQAANSLSLDISNIHKCLIGKSRSVKGHCCHYVSP